MKKYFAVLVILIIPTRSLASEPAYCGIYAVFGAAKAEGVESPDFDVLISAEYVSSFEGSTSTDLQKAAKRLGLHSEWMEGLSLIALAATSKPLILHVAPSGQFEKYNHWQLFLGWSGGKVRLLDANGQIFEEEPAVALARWDGSALVVSKGNAWIEYALIKVTDVSCRVFALLLVLIGGFYSAKLSTPKNYVGILLFSVLVVIATVTLLPVTHASSRIAIERSFSNFVPDTIDMSEIGIGKDNVLIDARYASDFNRGHIEGAINIPINSGDIEIAELKGRIPKTSKLVVYCQSSQCGFDEWIGKRLYVAGFENVIVMKQGIGEWRQAGHQNTD